jgi:transcriptional antiterminator RfaH
MLAPTQLSAPVAPWAVNNADPHREEIALENLQRQEFTAYCPMLRRRRSHARRVT